MDRYLRIALIIAAIGGFGLGASTTPPGGNWVFGGVESAVEMVLSIVFFHAWRAFKNR